MNTPDQSAAMGPGRRLFAGFDLGAHVAHGVLVDAVGSLVDAVLFERPEVAAAAAWAARADVVAVDAPSALSTGAHLALDDGLTPKFRGARCAEIALGREWGIWVPWATPPATPAPWMAHGFALYAAIDETGPSTVEVYPHAGFRVLDRRRLPPKVTVPGVRRRIEILARLGFGPTGLSAWSHDGVDAAMAALIARDVGLERAIVVGCGHDGTSIALPAGALRSTPPGESERPPDED